MAEEFPKKPTKNFCKINPKCAEFKKRKGQAHNGKFCSTGTKNPCPWSVFFKILFTMLIVWKTLANYVEVKNDDEYKVNTSKMSPGEKVLCPDESTEIEKVDEETVKLICKKGTCQKL